ncbi:MAG: hypothetical protein JO023_09235 [Chloroflexi bacterium]|nr:hypothetical protein [Chloroflexota bacterium]
MDPGTGRAGAVAHKGGPTEVHLAYHWCERAIKYHTAQMWAPLPFSETMVRDGEELVGWLVEAVLPHERALDRLRLAVYNRCRERCLEPPSPPRLKPFSAHAQVNAV